MNKKRGKEYAIYYDGTVVIQPNTYIKKVTNPRILDFLFDNKALKRYEIDFVAEHSEDEVLQMLNRQSVEVSVPTMNTCSHSSFYPSKYKLLLDEMILCELMCKDCFIKREV